MARYIGPVCRLCRREGMKLFLKGERCYTEKCAIEKRNFAPGQHGIHGFALQRTEIRETPDPVQCVAKFRVVRVDYEFLW